MENYDVAVVRCKTYDVETVKPALEEALNAVNGLDFVKPGMKIIIKPTLFRSKSPMQPQQPTLPCLRHLLKCFWHAVQMLR